MHLFSKQIFWACLALLLMARCAQIGVLTGGKRDTVPPKLVKAIPENASLNFHGNEIVLSFDEFVRLVDLTNQLIVSPKMKTQPEVETNGKKIIVSLKNADLAPNTTYRINFGNSVADMHEGNVLKGFEYTFSTGAYIDTLSIKVTLTDAFNGKAVPDALVSLYNNAKPLDSLIYIQEPNYIAKSNASGEFVFSNLPHSTYKMYALLDKNKNELYDGESEKVAFLPEDLQLNSDTAVALKLFQEEASKTFIKRSGAPYPGLVQVFSNKRSKWKVEPLLPSNRTNIFESQVGAEKDTISIIYKSLQDTLGLILNNLSINKIDTLLIPLPKEINSKKRSKKPSVNVSSGKLALNEKIRFSFLTWTDTARSDWSRIRLSYKKDSVWNTVPVRAHWVNVTTLEIDNKLDHEGPFTLKTDTNTFFDMRGSRYDSSVFVFKAQTKAEFGKVTIKLLLNKKQNYLVQIINDQETVIRQKEISFALSSSNAVTLDFVDLPPETYHVKIVYDDNSNKKWDTGNVLKKRQPEKAIVHSKQIKVLSDWEIEEEIVIKE